MLRIATPLLICSFIVTADVAARSRGPGAAILDRAIALHGGDRLRQLRGFLVDRNRASSNASDLRLTRERLTVLFPDGVRKDVVAPGGPTVSATAGEQVYFASWVFGRPVVPDLTEAARVRLRALLIQEAMLEPLMVLHDRQFLEINQSSGELLRGTYRGQPFAIGLSPEGQVRTITLNSALFNESDRADITLSFSDYRRVDGLLVPFRAEGTSNSRIVPDLGYEVTRWMANPPTTPSKLLSLAG